MSVISTSLGLLPFLCLMATIFVLQRKHGGELFPNASLGALIWTGLIWLATYSLSFLQLIYPHSILAFWLIYALAIGICCLRGKPARPALKLNAWNIIIGSIAAITLITALVYPPNNYDVLTYHMPRVTHWLQNHTLAPYPTSIDRQIGMAPLNAIIALQTYAPGKNDLFVNLAQWFSFAGCILAVRHITRMLGGGKTAAACAAIFAATLPTAIIQASNIDSCLLVSFYLCIAVVNYIQWKNSPSWRPIFSFGAALGFAILSKGSAYPIALPFVCLIAWHCLRQPKTRFSQGLAAAFVIITLNLPHLLYNYTGTGNLIGSSERNVNLHPSPGIICANILGNLLINEPFLLAGPGLEFWQDVSRSLGADSANHELLPWGGLEQAAPYMAPSDGISPNPLHTALLILIALCALSRKFHLPVTYTATISLSTFCFCAFLTWHPWLTRIQTSLFILFAPVFGIFLAQIHRDKARKAVLALLLTGAVWPLFLCVERPLAPASAVALYRPDVRHFLSSPRELLLFNNAPRFASEYAQAADKLAAAHAEKILLEIGDNGLEYPIWVLLTNRMAKMPVIRHPGQPNFQPDHIWSAPRMGENRAQKVEIIDMND